MIEAFTERENDVLELLCQGDSTQEIAEKLYIATTTVKTHISKLLQKSNKRTRLALILWAKGVI